MTLADPIVILLLFVVTFVFILTVKRGWNKGACLNFPPGPRPLPILGNLHQLNLKRPYRTLLELSEKYGPVFSIQMGPKKMVVLSGYKMVKEALVNQADAFAERPRIPIFEKFARGNGIIFAHGENWKVMRRFTLTTLRDFGMGRRTMENKILEECDYLIKDFESHKGSSFDTMNMMNAAVSNVIVSIMLGERFDYEDPTFLRLIHLINESVRLSGSPMVTLLLYIYTSHMKTKKMSSKSCFIDLNGSSACGRLIETGPIIYKAMFIISIHITVKPHVDHE
ncbi:clarin-3 [Platysternon megacephalum]|uniref:Clarin-3 n=1 Tax=Platysternon megacephalum TaxID=55544 RepID=A0A4D9EDZ1_9SAUR|nr:clarin-3 [Platysternon megacephalum]